MRFDTKELLYKEIKFFFILIAAMYSTDKFLWVYS